MTPAGFRRIALGLNGALEGAHRGHPDFRVGGKIFATLGYPDDTCGMVRLTPEQQRTFVRDDPDAFVPVNGKWGEQGATTVRLAAVDEETLGEALTLARQNTVLADERVPARKRRGSTRSKRARRKS